MVCMTAAAVFLVLVLRNLLVVFSECTAHFVNNNDNNNYYYKNNNKKKSSVATCRGRSWRTWEIGRIGKNYDKRFAQLFRYDQNKNQKKEVEKAPSSSSSSSTSSISTETRPSTNSANNKNNNNNNNKLDVSRKGTTSTKSTTTTQKEVSLLSKEKRAILASAKPIDVAYVDATNGHANHHHDPHRGGTFLKKKKKDRLLPIFVLDETSLRRRNPPFRIPSSKNEKKELCDDDVEKDNNNYQMLTQHIRVHKAKKMVVQAKKENQQQQQVKIFCAVYAHEGDHGRIPVIQETWGKKCDGFLVASNKTDTAVSAVNIPHEGPEDYENMWQKIRSTWSYIYDNYYDTYDFFHMGGVDMYVIVENLRHYVESPEIQQAATAAEAEAELKEEGALVVVPSQKDEKKKKRKGDKKAVEPVLQMPLYLGRRLALTGDMNRIFNSGGPGYTLNKAALKLLVTKGFPKHFVKERAFEEDVLIADTFRNFGVYPYETKDDTGAERYNIFEPGFHYSYRKPSPPNNDVTQDWYAQYSIDLKDGADQCSKESISFHYIDEDIMKKMHAILYGYCM